MSTTRRTLGIVAVAVGFAGLMAACGDSASSLPPVDEQYPAEVLELGEEVFGTTCSVCHGRSGRGRVGPSLVTIGHRYTYDEHLAVIRSGRGGMPSFGGTLTTEEIEAVAAFERVGLE